jgi:hypothetical protein
MFSNIEIFMKLVTKLFLILSLFLVLYSISSCNENNSDSTNDDDTESILSDILYAYDLTLEGDGDPETRYFTLPEELTDANWGLKAIVCDDAGYDLYAHAGEDIVADRYNITESCYTESLYLWLLIKDDECICAYKTVREDSYLVPGVFAVNESCE